MARDHGRANNYSVDPRFCPPDLFSFQGSREVRRPLRGRNSASGQGKQSQRLALSFAWVDVPLCQSWREYFASWWSHCSQEEGFMDRKAVFLISSAALDLQLKLWVTESACC
jgi:hypothetical protein